ncbi:MAG: polymer-forming cytoskeletal protein [Pseudomonadota bacterium]
MALQSNFFGKREAESLNRSPTLPSASTPPMPPGGNLSSSSPSTVSAVNPFSSGSPAASTSSGAASAAAKESTSKLTVGPNIKLKGVEITDCDTLVVEGLVEATMDSRVIQISEQGAFKGSADIDIAEIHGQFEGNLTARQKLVIYATGKVTGTVRYGKVIIEEGGQLGGEIQCSLAPAATTSAHKSGNGKDRETATVAAYD